MFAIFLHQKPLCSLFLFLAWIILWRNGQELPGGLPSGKKASNQRRSLKLVLPASQRVLLPRHRRAYDNSRVHRYADYQCLRNHAWPRGPRRPWRNQIRPASYSFQKATRPQRSWRVPPAKWRIRKIKWFTAWLSRHGLESRQKLLASFKRYFR